MALDTLYMLRMQQTWLEGGKPMESVFFFDHTAGTSGAGQLAVDFLSGLGLLIGNIQTTAVVNVGVNVINMGNPADFNFTPWAGTGTYEEQALPPYAAVGFTLKVNTRAVRKGSKRFAGIPETVQNNGQINDAPYRAKVELIRLALQQEIVSADDTWLPVIVKRIKEPVTGTVPLQYTYRLPTTGDPLVLGEVVVALTSDNLTHQVSREV